MSTHVGVLIMKKRSLPAIRLDSRNLLKATTKEMESIDDHYLEAYVMPRTDEALFEAAANGNEVVIVQGFIASTIEGHTCLLGRGGSDTSAALIAALINASRLEIWTDVHGMFTSDPRFVPSARLIRSISYREAQELAAMGAKVLHPRCLDPARFAGCPVEIRNTMDASSMDMTRISADVQSPTTAPPTSSPREAASSSGDV
jgi:diaminopimelate decarboxylase/aspartate kinase